jgi:hypothetical protein
MIEQCAFDRVTGGGFSDDIVISIESPVAAAFLCTAMIAALIDLYLRYQAASIYANPFILAQCAGTRTMTCCIAAAGGFFRLGEV